jgi:hypothetical protein
MPSYSNLLADVANTIVVEPTNAPLLAIFPEWVLAAEGRIVRELDLVAANVRDSSASTTAGSRNFNLPTSIGTFLIITDLNVVTPASTAPESGTRNRLTPVSLSVLDWTYPSTTGSGVPQFFAYVTQDTYSAPAQSQVVFGPWPDAAYRVEVVGVVQPAGLTSINGTTWLSVNLYDVLFKATMMEAVAWQQNFSVGADNPAMAVNWKSAYAEAKDSAIKWQARARFGGASWTSASLEPIAQPQRG